ncbi:hypothetical protein T09_6132 [Trichinella sp. T9]|nr:hypothetical protein T09_6132 [Trichinella sp. T9]
MPPALTGTADAAQDCILVFYCRRGVIISHLIMCNAVSCLKAHFQAQQQQQSRHRSQKKTILIAAA